MSEMRAVSLLLWQDRRRRFTRGDGIASHRFLESWRREDEGQGDPEWAQMLDEWYSDGGRP